MRTVEVLGVPVAAGRFDEALAFLAERVARREPTVISCANAWSLVLALDDPEHRARLARADLLLADGMPVVWIARLRGVRASRVHADDLMLAACAAFPRWGHFLVGGAEGQPERVADALRRRLPGIEIAGQRATPVRPVPAEESEAIVEAIRRSGAGMVWVGMGTPAQDTWMHAFARRAGVPMAGVGSAFDLLSGRTRPVPEWAKQSGLQWLFRLVQEPRRLGPRYLTTNPRFLWHAARELARGCEPRVYLRPATTADAQRLFEWRNEEATRRASFSSEPIPWVAHEIWLADRLAPDSRTRIFLVLDARDREVGYVRFDVDREGSAEVSVAIDARERGRGLGTAAIRAATERIADAGVRRVVARVRPENRASRMAFGRAGYTEMASDIFERIIAPGPS